MKRILSITSLLLLTACSKSAEQKLCLADAVVVPVAGAVATGVSLGVPSIGAPTQVAIAADAPVHKQIQVDCAQLLSAPTIPTAPATSAAQQ